MPHDDNDILDDLFHGCAFMAFVEQARVQGDWPDIDVVRRRAYEHYENELRAKNEATATVQTPVRTESVQP